MTHPAAIAGPHVERHPTREDEPRFVIHGVPWSAYVGFRDALDAQGSRVGMIYLDGNLELVSPSHVHEQVEMILARLLETLAAASDVDVWGFGSTTFRREAAQGGLEPDVCYAFSGADPEPSRPDLAIEVVVSNPLADKLEVYRRLGVPEVWVWRDGALTIHRLAPEGYSVQARSGLLPGLDAGLLARFVRPGESLTRLAREYQRALDRADR